MDTSALVKRYIREKGSKQVEHLTAEKKNEIHLSEITLPEVMATFAAKSRAPQGLSKKRFDDACSLFLTDCETDYNLIAPSRPIIDLAVQLTRRRKVRGCDAIQLATALTLNESLRAAKLPELVFVVCDAELLNAANEEGLATENPEEII
jgi:predicted nucleic acid-binding protein